ncbi:MAG: hypothetical protein JWO74_3996 [Solirubrobacterales bacterium]|jgi:hypothetical protein|nr:hypothetical protein [Solirubrobacterales bacterium]
MARIDPRQIGVHDGSTASSSRSSPPVEPAFPSWRVGFHYDRPSAFAAHACAPGGGRRRNGRRGSRGPRRVPDDQLAW